MTDESEDRVAEARAGMPRWVKVFAVTGAAAVVVLIVAMLAGGGPGEHGPGRHGQGNHPLPLPGASASSLVAAR